MASMTRLHRADRLQDTTNMHLVNILKGGIVYSNEVLIMSSMHSKGRFIHSLSHGLEPTLAIHKDKLLIAPYGLDDSTWDPSKDKLIPAIYTNNDMEGKSMCKVALQQRLGLHRHTSTVIVGCVLLEVSDVDLEKLKASVVSEYRRDIQFIFMGPTKSMNNILESFQELKGENIKFVDKYDEAVLHLIFAGSDVILCPSFHDSVLQVPLKAMKYGAVPVAITCGDGKMSDTDDQDDSERTKLSQFISTAFANMSLSQALDEIKNNPVKWNERMKDAMTMDFSWNGECYDTHISAYSFIKSL